MKNVLKILKYHKHGHNKIILELSFTVFVLTRLLTFITVLADLTDSVVLKHIFLNDNIHEILYWAHCISYTTKYITY